MDIIRYRKATMDDAAFLAMVVAEALGNNLIERMAMGEDTLQDRELIQQLASVCQRTDTLYSWKHALMAISPDNQPIGAIVAYPGEGYMESRHLTFSLLSNLITFDVNIMDAETREGEYYLDSLAVDPRWRGKGIARRLLMSAQQEAKQMGRPAILACAPDNCGAKRLYEALGFHEEGHLFIFGEDYLRMVSSSVTSS